MGCPDLYPLPDFFWAAQTFAHCLGCLPAGQFCWQLAWWLVYITQPITSSLYPSLHTPSISSFAACTLSNDDCLPTRRCLAPTAATLTLSLQLAVVVGGCPTCGWWLFAATTPRPLRWLHLHGQPLMRAVGSRFHLGGCLSATTTPHTNRQLLLPLSVDRSFLLPAPLQHHSTCTHSLQRLTQPNPPYLVSRQSFHDGSVADVRPIRMSYGSYGS